MSKLLVRERTHRATALGITLKEKPDLIVLDLGLPAGDGFAVLKSMYPALSNVLVIVLTSRFGGQ